MSSVRVEIDGHAYRMACGEGEEARLTALAAELDRTVTAMRKRLGEIGDRRLMVMAALTLLDRVQTAETRAADLAGRAERLERSREAAVLAADADDEPLVARIEALAATVDALTAQIHRGVRRVQHDDEAPSFTAARVDRSAPPAEAPSFTAARAEPAAPPAPTFLPVEPAEPAPGPPPAERARVGRSYGSIAGRRPAAEPTFARARPDAAPPAESAPDALGDVVPGESRDG